MNSVVKAILEGKDIQQSIAVNEKTKFDLKKALQKCEKGSELSGKLDYGLSDEELITLAKLHKENPDLRVKIEDLLTDINFHSECADFEKGRYDKYLGKNDPDGLKTQKAQAYAIESLRELKKSLNKVMDAFEDPYLDEDKLEYLNKFKKKLDSLHLELVSYADYMEDDLLKAQGIANEAKIQEETGDASYYEVVYGYQMAIVKTDWPTTDYGAITDILIDNLEKEGVKEPYLIPLDQAEEEYNPDEYVVGGNHSLALIHNGNFNIVSIPEQNAKRYQKNDHVEIYEAL